MPKLVVRLAVSMAMAVVVMTGLEALRLRHPRVVAAAKPEESSPSLVAAVPRLRFRAAVAAAPVVSQVGAPRESFGMARIYGRVVGPSGSLDDLDLAIEDDERSYTPKLGENGTFEINLPVGRYNIVACSGDEVAAADGIEVRTDENREVILILSTGASITGRIEGCDGPCQVVTVGADAPTTVRRLHTVESDDEGEFAVDGLVPGRAYDLVFEAEGSRRVVMHALSAPRQDLVVTLEPARTLAGGFGLDLGQDCPMMHVTLESTGEDASTQMANFDGNCRFQFADLPEADSVHLSADGEGWHFERDIALPPHGDPPFVCLHPTCREPPAEAKAELTRAPRGGSATMGRVRIL